MADIFISYSRKDSDQALMFAEVLRSEGYDVWIDQHGIEAAASWSNEIVQAIDSSKVLIILLSDSSVRSDNVAREVSLAFESKKIILPIDIEPVTLSPQFRYQLAGIQRAQLKDFDYILRALTKLGVEQKNNTDVTSEKSDTVRQRMRSSEESKPQLLRLGVLPFDDLSPGKENEWFADGMLDELIGTLGSLSTLIVPGRSSVMVYKKDRPKASVIGAELEVRYIVEGTVRKAGEKIRISASLTDTKTNSQLWNNKFDGTFDDIFDFQERVAREITEGLKLQLTPHDQKKIEKAISANPEAYQLYQKARGYANHQTKQDFLYAVDCLNEAVRLDPLFATAYAALSRLYSELFRRFDRKAEHLPAAIEAMEKARHIDPQLPMVYMALSEIHLQQGERDEAIRAVEKMIELEPKNCLSHVELGYIYSELHEYKEAIPYFEDALHLDPTLLPAHNNLCIIHHNLKDTDNLQKAAERALPYFERHLKKNPDDLTSELSYAFQLDVLGRTEESMKIVDKIAAHPYADGSCIYNCASLYARKGLYQKAFDALGKAIVKGTVDLDNINNDEDLKPLQTMPEFAELLKKIF